LAVEDRAAGAARRADLDYRHPGQRNVPPHYVQVNAGAVSLQPVEGAGTALEVPAGDVVFDCGDTQACEAVAEDLRKLIALMRAPGFAAPAPATASRRSPACRSSMRRRCKARLPAGRSTWADGTYVFCFPL
jgi:hypothetical protein